MHATPHNNNVNANSEGPISDHMTRGVTQFSVPMETDDFLTGLLKFLAGVTHTDTHTIQTHKSGGYSSALFPTSSDSSTYEHPCTRKHTY